MSKKETFVVIVALASHTSPSRGASTRRLLQQPQSCVDCHPLRLGTHNRASPSWGALSSPLNCSSHPPPCLHKATTTHAQHSHMPLADCTVMPRTPSPACRCLNSPTDIPTATVAQSWTASWPAKPPPRDIEDVAWPSSTYSQGNALGPDPAASMPLQHHKP